MKYLATLTMLAAIVCTDTQTAQAQTPEDFATECAELVESAITRLENALGKTTRRCLRAIREAKASGDIAKARQIARACIDDINSTTRAADVYVKNVCGRCVNALMDMGEFELAGRVRNFCANSLDTIKGLGERARAAVRNAVS